MAKNSLELIALMGEGGEMRTYFKQACGGADWVDGIYNDVVAALGEGLTYFPLADEKEMGGWLNWLEQHPRFAGMSQFRTAEGWQVSIAVDTPTNMLIITRITLLDAMYTAFNAFNQATAAPAA